MLNRWRYRSGQFFSALLGRVTRAELKEAKSVLGPELYTIFALMPCSGKRHALTVLSKVRGNRCDDRQVWQAALLHDSGKYDPACGNSVTLAHRVAVVLLEAVPPGRRLLSRLASHRKSDGIGGKLLYPFYLSKHHPRLGAETAARHGAAAEVVELIAMHHASSQKKELRALQAADDRS